jgi:hypothetical protein
MISYTIFEYNGDTNSYKEVGYADAHDSAQARKLFKRESGWKPKKGIRLFAKPPICR